MNRLRNIYAILTIVLLSFICIKTNANNEQHQIDSLKKELLMSSNDSVRINYYRQISLLFRQISLDSSLLYIDKCIAIAKSTNNLKGLANAYFNKGIINYLSESFESSQKNYLSALELYTSLKDSVNILGVYTNLGNLYSLGFDKQSAIDYYIKALEISKLINNSAGIANNSNNIGLIYRDLKYYDIATEYLHRTLEIDLRSGNQEFIAQSYANLARTYLPAKNFEKTFQNLIEAYNRIDFVKDIDVRIEILSCAGEYYLEINKPDSALKYIREGIKVADQSGRKRMLTYTYFLIGRYLILEGKYEIAITHIKEAIKLTDSLKIKENKDLYFEYISEAYAKLNDHKNAHLSLITANAIQDSIHMDEIQLQLSNFEKQKELARIQDAFQFEQLKKQNDFEKRTLTLKLTTIFSFILIFLLVALIFIMIRSSRNKSKANLQLRNQNEIIENQSEELKMTVGQLEQNQMELKQSNTAKDKFFSIIAHDLKNPFNVILGYADILNTEYDDFSEKDRKKMISEIDKASKITFNLLDNLLTWSRAQQGKIQLKPEVLNVKELVQRSCEPYQFNAKKKQINIKNNISEELEIKTDRFTVSTVIANLLNNAIKFTPDHGSIKISASIFDGHIKFNVEDSGVGMSKKAVNNLFNFNENSSTKGTNDEIGTGLGLMICYELIKLNKGEISVNSEEGKGSIFTFTLPIAKTDE